MAIIDPKVFGLMTAAHLRISAFPGELKRVEQMIKDTPQVVIASRVTGVDCFVAEIMVRDEQELQAVVDQFETVAATDAAIILSSTVARRLPKL
jgi:Lrp/AsnC family leucine-responsive transcriptional regulator